MPVCTQCGGNDFIEEDGFYYCQLCHIQSQDIRVEETEVDDIHNITVTKTPVDVSQRVETEKEEKKQELGRPWFLQEGYQCILKKQVEKLIELGADKRLDEIVFRLWINYLNKLKVAFCETEHIVQPTIHLSARARDIRPGSFDNPGVSRKSSKRTSIPSYNDMSNLVLEQELDDIEFYSDDNPVGQDDKQLKHKFRTKADPTTFTPSRHRLRNEIEWMTLNETLTFLYVALLFTNNHVTPSELISLAENDIIPYKSAITCLKDDMKTSSNDRSLFTTQFCPSTAKLREHSSALLRLLDIKELPLFPLTTILHKFIRKLHLPGEVHALIVNLSEILNLNLRPYREKRIILDIEVMAVAFIFLGIKLLFGLNDSREHFLTDCARKLSELLPDQNFFVWEDWQTYISCKYNISNDLINKDSHFLHEVADVDKFVEFYRTSIQHKNMGIARKQRSKVFDAIVPSMTEFSKIAKQSEPEKVSEQPMEVEFENPLDLLNPSLEKQWKLETADSKQKEKFHGSSIKYLRSFTDLLKDIQNKDDGASVNTSESLETNMDSSDIECAQSTDTQKKHKKKRKRTHSSGSSQTSKQDRHLNLTESVRTDVKNIMKSIEKQKDGYVIYKKQKKFQNLKEVFMSFDSRRHLTYDWLLGILSHMIRCRKDALESMLQDLEVFILDNEDRKLNVHLQSFKCVYFQ